VRTALLLVLALAAGCSRPEAKHEARFAAMASECLAMAAYEAIRAESLFRVSPPCCGKCKDGKVRSGDGLAMVDCPCDPGCECKTKK
jgi:hypothetical protein